MTDIYGGFIVGCKRTGENSIWQVQRGLILIKFSLVNSV